MAGWPLIESAAVAMRWMAAKASAGLMWGLGLSWAIVPSRKKSRNLLWNLVSQLLFSSIVAGVPANRAVVPRFLNVGFTNFTANVFEPSRSWWCHDC